MENDAVDPFDFQTQGGLKNGGPTHCFVVKSNEIGIYLHDNAAAVWEVSLDENFSVGV